MFLKVIKMKSLLLAASVLIMLGVIASTNSIVLADAQSAACEGIQAAIGGGCDSGEAETKINGTINTAINILSFVVAVISVIMIIIAGIKFVTSTGDSNSVSGAKNTIIYAVVGLIIVALSQTIVKFVLARIT